MKVVKGPPQNLIRLFISLDGVILVDTMSITTHIDSDRGIRFHIISGAVMPDVISSELSETLSRPDFDPTIPALWDVRDAEGSISAREIKALAQLVGGLWKDQEPPRVALVVAPGLQYGLARMYQQYADLARKIEIQVFKEEEEAVAWLTSSPSQTDSP
ncbi:STAS/SEC14 domain-containing protein [Candidatus Zixiibacteriota bacterium]